MVRLPDPFPFRNFVYMLAVIYKRLLLGFVKTNHSIPKGGLARAASTDCTLVSAAARRAVLHVKLGLEFDYTPSGENVNTFTSILGARERTCTQDLPIVLAIERAKENTYKLTMVMLQTKAILPAKVFKNACEASAQPCKAFCYEMASFLKRTEDFLIFV